EAPMRRYHWLVLPQGMKNSPVICQWCVSEVLSPVWKAYPKARIVHYMDDVLVCAREKSYLDLALREVIQAIKRAGMEIQPDKIQHLAPWNYLGYRIAEKTVTPQLLSLQDRPSTLRELHQLCGSINWIRPLVGLKSMDLEPLFQLLKGGGALDSPISLTKEAEDTISKVMLALTSKRAHRTNPKIPFRFVILGETLKYHGLVFQWDEGERDPLLIIEWIFLPHSPSKTISRPQELVAELITRARHQLKTLAGCDFAYIHVPWKHHKFEEVLQESENLQLALESYSGQIGSQKLKHRLFNLEFHLAPNFVQSKIPIKNALTIFTDGSGSSHKDPDTLEWDKEVRVIEGSPQIAELAAVVRVFERFEERPVNLVTDSAYVAGVASRAEHSLLKEVPNPTLFGLLARLVELLSHRKHPFYVLHVRSHSGLPGFISEGNARADALAMPVQVCNIPDIFAQARSSHQFFHQNATALKRMFNITVDQARAIVATCPTCQTHQLPAFNKGGLNSCQLWQMDVTHYAPFGRLRFIHVSVDTFSGATFASVHTGEK
ncbi:POK11 protein, partial [Drymodes brunneopygia]|nr:POK11 protein [Drymodes brunneopygia]